MKEREQRGVQSIFSRLQQQIVPARGSSTSIESRTLFVSAASIIPIPVRMRAVQAELQNPFYRPNPYYVPQRFYSHEKPSPYAQYSPYKSAIREDHDMTDASPHSRQPHYKASPLGGSRFEPARREGQALKRKNINSIENPFYRKHLLPTAAEAGFTEESCRSEAEARNVRLFESRRVEERKENNYFKMPSLKSIPSEHEKEKENAPSRKYLSSELKIKLKSQAQLPPLATLPSCGPSRQALVTLGRVETSVERYPSIEGRSLYPECITFKGKTYYQQAIC